MPQTANFGFPLWADTPPEGATGKDLRDAIIGEGADSLAQRLDSILQEILVTLENKENQIDKVNFIDDGFEVNINNVNYPTTMAVYDFVVSHTSKKIGNAEATIFTPLVKWDGNTDGLFNILGMFYKVSENTETPKQIKFDMSFRGQDNTVHTYDFFTGMRSDTAVTDFKDMLGITAYQIYGTIGGFIAERAGILPAEFIEQMTGTNPGEDIPFEAGTYVIGVQQGDEFLFVSNAESCIPVKEYIDSKFNELCELMDSKESDT